MWNSKLHFSAINISDAAIYLPSMPSKFLHHMFGDAARALQAGAGSRDAYAVREQASTEAPDTMTERELAFIAERDSVFLATVTADDWPYVQHRGGAPGFIRHLGGNRLCLPNYVGNRQYISSGNLQSNGRVALICLDYAARRRLKLVGHGRVVRVGEDPRLAHVLEAAGDPVVAATVIDVIGFDWNCSKYITPRFTRDAVNGEIENLRKENEALRARLADIGERLT